MFLKMIRCICLTKRSSGTERCKNYAKFPYETPAFCYVHHKRCNRIIINNSLEEEKLCKTDSMVLGINNKKEKKEIFFYTFANKIEIMKKKLPRTKKSLRGISEKYFDWHESLIQGRFMHKNISQILDFGIKGSWIFLITSRCEGDIRDFIFDKKTAPSCHCQILTALENIQKHQIVHRDIHKGNIFWKATREKKIDGVMTHGINFVLGDFDMALCLHPLTSLRIEPESLHYVGRRIKRNPPGSSSLKFESLERCYLSKAPSKAEIELYNISNSIPIDFYTDIYMLYRCFKETEEKTKAYERFLNETEYFSFATKFETKRIDLFLAEELKKKALKCL